MTTSTEILEKVQARIEKKEARLKKIARNTARGQGKIDKLLEEPQSKERDAAIAVIQKIQDTRIGRVEEIEESIHFLTSLLPKEELEVDPSNLKVVKF